MNDHELDARLRAKYRARSTEAAPPMLARRVLAIPANSPQRRGRLPRPLFGGTNLMFSATKALVVIAVLALSGALLTSTSNDSANPQQADAVTSSDDPVLAPRPVSGTVTDGEWPDAEETSLGNAMYEWTSEPVTTTWASKDARLVGVGQFVEHGLQHFTSYTGLRSSAWSIETKDGGWNGSGHAYSTAKGGRDFLVLTGTGAYEGLSAYIAIAPGSTSDSESDVREFEGVIFPGSMPPPPDLPAAE